MVALSERTDDGSGKRERRNRHCLQVQNVSVPPGAGALTARARGSGSDQYSEKHLWVFSGCL